jgi:hypothetical protein
MCVAGAEPELAPSGFSAVAAMAVGVWSAMVAKLALIRCAEGNRKNGKSYVPMCNNRKLLLVQIRMCVCYITCTYVIIHNNNN